MTILQKVVSQEAPKFLGLLDRGVQLLERGTRRAHNQGKHTYAVRDRKDPVRTGQMCSEGKEIRPVECGDHVDRDGARRERPRQENQYLDQPSHLEARLDDNVACRRPHDHRRPGRPCGHRDAVDERSKRARSREKAYEVIEAELIGIDLDDPRAGFYKRNEKDRDDR